MDEAQALADRVAIIAQGRIIRQGTPRELTGGADSTTIRFRLRTGISIPAEFAATASGGIYTIATSAPTEALHRITTWALEGNIDLDDLRVGQTTLEEVYLQITEAEPEGSKE
jgi:ABC-2 type transport system ATP-binding protein